ncbi:hypothetical protein OHF12_10875, partial [Escherichia coli]|nr:hypothetical protein [Escherichia coli]
PSVAEQEGQLIETEATGAPQIHHHTLNQEAGSITQQMTRIQTCNETLLFVQDVNKYLKIN